MGYSGKFFNHGTEEENKGDEYLLRMYYLLNCYFPIEVNKIFWFSIERSHEFTWFGHMWSHQQPHLYENVSILEADMILNKNFAIVSFVSFIECTS